MTRTDALAEATAARDAALAACRDAQVAAWNGTGTRKASRNASEELEFWIGKVAFLSNPLGWAEGAWA